MEKSIFVTFSGFSLPRFIAAGITLQLWDVFVVASVVVDVFIDGAHTNDSNSAETLEKSLRATLLLKLFARMHNGMGFALIMDTLISVNRP